MNELEKWFNDIEKNLKSFFDRNDLKKVINNYSLLEKVDVIEKNNNVYVMISIPNLTNDHKLEVDINQNQLIIYGYLDRINDLKVDKGIRYTSSFSEYFYKAIPLPAVVTKKGAKAVVEDGKMWITLKKLTELQDSSGEINIDYK